MLSRVSSTSCMTVPHSSRRFCSLLILRALTKPPARVRQTAPIKYRFIADLHGQNRMLTFVAENNWLKNLQRDASCERVMDYPTLRRDVFVERTSHPSWLK